MKFHKQHKIQVGLLAWQGFGHTSILGNEPKGGCVDQQKTRFLLTGHLTKKPIVCDDGVNPFLRIPKYS